MEKLEQWILAQRLDQDRFQTCVCWTLLVMAVIAMIPPVSIIMDTKDQMGCVGTEFTIFAQYGIHLWLTDIFSDFRTYAESKQLGGGKVCYRLVVGENPLEESYEPSIFIPDNYYWLNAAEDEIGTLSSNRSHNCVNTTSIPMGLVTWTSVGEVLDSPLPFADLLSIAQYGWTNYTTGLNISSNISVPTSVDSLYYAHGHPNVTTSGAFGIMAALKDMSITTDSVVSLRELEFMIREYGETDIRHIYTMMDRGPDYIHAALAFENDVVHLNEEYGATLEYLWGQKLHFVYFTGTYWMQHPICVLNEASWMTSTKYDIGMEFMNYASNRTSSLETHGIRPQDGVLTSASTIITDNGVDPTITTDESDSFNLPSVSTISQIQYSWQKIKRPVYLTILLDISSMMSESVTNKYTRWYYVTKALPQLAENLEDTAMIDMVCFSAEALECSVTGFAFNATLETSRDSLYDFLSDDLIQSANPTVAVYSLLNSTYASVKQTKLSNTKDGSFYNYVILVISTADNSDTADDAKASLLSEITMSESPDEIHVFTVLAFGDENSAIADVFDEIGERTNSPSYVGTSDMEEIIEKITYYF